MRVFVLLLLDHLRNIGSDNDFFLIAARPPFESNYPLITGNFLDSEGNVLFKLVQNVLVINPGHCSKIKSDRIGYEIHDSEENLILKVETRFTNLPGQQGDMWVTTIEGNFYNREGERVVEANAEEGFIETNIGCAMGYTGNGFMFSLGMSEEQQELAAMALAHFGKVFQPLSGIHENEDILLDGKVIMPGAIIRNCRIRSVTGDFLALGGTISDNQVLLDGPAFMIAKLLGVTPAQAQENPNPEEITEE